MNITVQKQNNDVLNSAFVLVGASLGYSNAFEISTRAKNDKVYHFSCPDRATRPASNSSRDPSTGWRCHSAGTSAIIFSRDSVRMKCVWEHILPMSMSLRLILGSGYVFRVRIPQF